MASEEQTARLQQLTDEFVDQVGDAAAPLIDAWWANRAQQMEGRGLSDAVKERMVNHAIADYESILSSPATAEEALIVGVITPDSSTAADVWLQAAIDPAFIKPEDTGDEIALDDGEIVPLDNVEPITLPDGSVLNAEIAADILSKMTRWPMQGGLLDEGIYADESGIPLSDDEAVAYLAGQSVADQYGRPAPSAHEQLDGSSAPDDGGDDGRVGGLAPMRPE